MTFRVYSKISIPVNVKVGDTLKDDSIVVWRCNNRVLLVAPKSTKIKCRWSEDFSEVFEELEKQGFDSSEWFISTLEHLKLAHNNIPDEFDSDIYWSSVEISSRTAEIYCFNNACNGGCDKVGIFNVRPFGFFNIMQFDDIESPLWNDYQFFIDSLPNKYNQNSFNLIQLNENEVVCDKYDSPIVTNQGTYLTVDEALNSWAVHDAIHFLACLPFNADGETAVAKIEKELNCGWSSYGEHLNTYSSFEYQQNCNYKIKENLTLELIEKTANDIRYLMDT